ncbi:MAG: 4-phosphoerythronate dehydrogenase PdxB [Bacteroidales bacterium]|jgi:erythronate-4-phosphate dehydrogenase
MIKIVADDRIPFLKGILEPYADVKYLPGRDIDRKSISGADALIIRTRTKCTEQLLKGSDIKFIGTATIGFDHIDTRYCDSNGIKWTNAPGCNSSSVQQYVAAALLKISNEFRFPLKDKTMGIAGVGNVGSKIEKMAALLGMKVLLNDPPRARKEGPERFTYIETLLKESDIISLHVPLTIVGQDKTYHMINDGSLKKVKKGTWLINSSRGEVADTVSLKRALASGKLAGAVLDVWEHEPDIDQELMHISFIATPHIAGYSTDGKANGTANVVNDLANFFNLQIKNWYPYDLPEPEEPVIEISCKGKDTEDIIREAVDHTYNISEDDLKLRFSPADFENQRGNYKVRREFPAYSVKLSGGNKQIRILLENFGFRVLQ